MPVIPRIERSQVQGRVSIPAPQLRSSVSPEAAGAPGRAAAQLGNVVADIGMGLIEKEQRAERDLKSLEMARDLDQEISQFTESFQGRQDYEQFENDTRKKMEDIRSRYQQRVGGDRTLQVVFERLYNQTSSQLGQFAKTTKFNVMSDRALSAFNAGRDNALQAYASSGSPEEREIILNDLEVSTAEMVVSGFMKNTDADAILRDFTDRAEEVRADRVIEADPAAAEVLLKGEDFATLDPKIRQGKIEKAQLRQQQMAEQAEQAERDLREAGERAQEDRAIQWTTQYAENGIVDIATLREDLRDKKITREFFNSMMDDIRTGQSKGQSMENEILEVEEQIRDGVINREGILVNRFLTAGDKRELIDRLESVQDEKFKVNLDLGETELKAAIVTSGPLAPLDTGEAERLAAAKKELYRRLKTGDEPLDTITQDLVNRYRTRPANLSSLPKPRFSNPPKTPEDVKLAKDALLFRMSEGGVNMNTVEGQQMMQTEIDLLIKYQQVLERTSNGR